ncbi:MAG: Hpt domain-containing protein [Myxococcota bacterium]|nr:Hpt domain-containing protein [Myxococcota bacterium]
MPLHVDPAVEALLRAARDDYAASLPAKLAALRALVDAGAWRDAQRGAHRLRGSAGTYGFEALGGLVTELEELLIEGGEAPSLSCRGRIADALRFLQLEIGRIHEEPQ